MLDVFRLALVRKQHVLRQYPELAFPQVFDQLQWKEPEAKLLCERARQGFLSNGRSFLRQYRQPKTTFSYIKITGHDGPVCACAWAPDGKTIISAGSDGLLKLWDSRTGREIRTLWSNPTRFIYDSRGFYRRVGGIEDCSFSPNGTKIVFTALDKNLRILDLDTGGEIHRSCELDSNTVGLAKSFFSPNGKKILALFDENLAIFDSELSGELLTLFVKGESFSCCSWSSDSALIIAGTNNGDFFVFDAEDGQIIQRFGLSRETTIFAQKARIGNPVLDCSWSPDRKKVLSAHKWSILGGDFQWERLFIWDAESGRREKDLEGHTDSVTACAWFPDGKRLVSGSRDKTLKLWETRTGQEIITLTGHTAAVTDCAVSADGTRICSAGEDGALLVWDAAGSYSGESLRAHSGAISSCDWSQSSDIVSTAGFDNGINILEGGSGIVVGKLEGHQLEIRAANLAKDGKLLISGSIDGTLRVWDTEHGREIAVFEAGYVLACALSPDGRMAVSSNASGGIKIWDIINNCLLFEFTGHSGFVKVVAWSASGDSLVSGGADGNLHIWDARQRQLKATLQGHKGPVLAAGFVLDDRELISMGFDDTFIVWDAETGKKKKRLQQQAVRMPAFESGSDELDYIKIWDLSGNQLLAEIKGREVAVHNFGRHFEGRKIIYDFYHKDAYLEVSGKIFDFEVQGFAPSPDGRLIAAGRPDGSVSIWNIGTGRIIQVLRGHVGKVRFCGWPAGKRLLISSGDDGKIILWGLEAGERQSVYFAEDSVRAVAFAADGMRFVAGDNSGNVYFIKVEEPDLGPILKRKKS